MTIIAIIPARGGSKGIPLKNIRLFNGKPLIAWTIEAALKSKSVDEVYVSTDSALIAEISEQFGAKVIRRPDELSNDKATSETALLDALEQLSKQRIESDLLVFLQCTAPFLTSADIDGTVEKLLIEKADSALAVVPFEHFLWQYNENHEAVGINHDGLYRKRRQDLAPQYLEAGSVYVMVTEKFKEAKTRFCGKTVLYEIDDPRRELEIDDASEFFMAERKLEWFKKSSDEQERYRIQAKQFERKLSNIKAVIFDFDGVFTDDSVYIDDQGKESVRCSRSDGYGIEQILNGTDLKLYVVSKETNNCVLERCKKLNLEVINGCNDKLSSIQQWLKLNGMDINEVLYCGNDLNDAALLGKVGLFCCPYNSAKEIIYRADYCSMTSGSNGFVREICDMIIAYKNRKPALKCNYKKGDHDIRPWGTWEVLQANSNECIKIIKILPEMRLSYQSHKFRKELWLIKTGEGLVTLDDHDFTVRYKDTVEIKCCQKHRIKNTSNTDILEIIEIQSGNSLYEDDIIRFEDDFGRSNLE